MRLKRSTWPFPWGWYGVVHEWDMLQSCCNLSNNLFSNSPPLFMMYFMGNPKWRIKSLYSLLAAVLADLFWVAICIHSHHGFSLDGQNQSILTQMHMVMLSLWVGVEHMSW